jgi:hypothetical protein
VQGLVVAMVDNAVLPCFSGPVDQSVDGLEIADDVNVVFALWFQVVECQTAILFVSLEIRDNAVHPAGGVG